MEKKPLNISLEYNELFDDIQQFINTHPKWKGYDITVSFSMGTVLPSGSDLHVYDSSVFPMDYTEITLYSLPNPKKINE